LKIRVINGPTYFFLSKASKPAKLKLPRQLRWARGESQHLPQSLRSPKQNGIIEREPSRGIEYLQLMMLVVSSYTSCKIVILSYSRIITNDLFQGKVIVQHIQCFNKSTKFVIPAKAGIQEQTDWFPAFAGTMPCFPVKPGMA